MDVNLHPIEEDTLIFAASVSSAWRRRQQRRGARRDQVDRGPSSF